MGIHFEPLFGGGMPAFDSRFEGFWLDKPDWDQTLTGLRQSGETGPQEEQQLRQFTQHGYVILRGAVSSSVIGALTREISLIHRHSEHYVVRTHRQAYAHATKAAMANKKSRLIDLHVNSGHARHALFSPAIKRFIFALRRVFPALSKALRGIRQYTHQHPE